MGFGGEPALGLAEKSGLKRVLSINLFEKIGRQQVST